VFYNPLTISKTLGVIALAFSLSACSPTIKVTAENMPAAPEAGDILLEEYRIGVGDSLNVSVWRNPDLSTQVVVLPDGNISVPLAGNVRAAGRSTESLAATIKEALTSFVRQPEVTVSVTSATSSNYLQRVRVTGAVSSPVSIMYSRGLTVLDVILLSGGVTPFANGNRATLYRNRNGEVQVFPILLDDILTKGKLETNYPLVPADVITVPEKSF
jgi:polysaccharide export outer membrane protein